MQKLFSSEEELYREYGKLAKKIQLRLSVLQAAKNLSEVPSGPPDRIHPLKGHRKNEYAVWLNENYRLVFQAYYGEDKTTEEIETKNVSQILILSVEDYHGS